MNKQMPSSQSVNKVIQAVLLQVDFLSECGLDVCVAVAAHKRIQFWTNSSWREDLKEAIKTAANYQADLEKDNMNLDMFVEMESQSSNRGDDINQDKRTDASSVPTTPPHEVRTEDQASEHYVIDEEAIVAEPTDAHRDITLSLDCSCLGEDPSPTNFTPPSCVGTKDPADESSVMEEPTIKSEPVEVDLMQTEMEQNRSCVEEGIATRDEHASLEFNTVRPTRTSMRRKTFQMKSKSGKRQEKQKPLKKRDAKEKTFQCILCKHSTARKSDLKKHMAVHQRATPNAHSKCTECDYITEFSYNLKKHMKTHVKPTYFFCKLCKYRTTRSRLLRAHVFLHEGESFKCNLCDYKGIRNADLVSHMKIHTGGTYNCEQCDYKTVRRIDLLIHMRKHTGETFNCDHCNYSTIRTSDLLRHVKNSHTTDPEATSFDCEHCDSKFSSKGALTTHIRKHPIGIFYCKHCDYQSFKRRYLLGHIKRRHPEISG